MTRTLGIVAVLLSASVAMAAEPVGFALSGIQDLGALGQGIPVPVEGGSVTVNLLGAGAGTVGGMQAYLQVDPRALFTAAGVANIGGVFTNPGTSASEVVDISSGDHATLWSFGSTANIAVPATNGILAQVTVTVPALPYGTKLLLTTDTDWGASTFDSGAPVGQASTFIVATPEPVSALLLLAGLPLIRRRRA